MTSEIIYKFQEFLAEAAKAEEKKTTKEVNEKETAGYDYKDKKNLNNQIFDQYINGLRVEMEKDPKLTIDEAREVVAKNLEKDPIFYTKNAPFKVDGLGYEELKQQEEPKGKYKSSGYGDLKENDMKKSEKLKELLEEAVAGIPSIGNPFANRKKEAYENSFEAFLAESLELKSLAKQIYQMLKKEGLKQVKLTNQELGPVGSFGQKVGKTIGNAPDSNAPHAIIGYTDDEIDMELAGPTKEDVEKFINKIKSEFSNFEYKITGKEGIGWNNGGYTARVEITDSKTTSEIKSIKEGEAAYEYEKGKSAGEKEEKKKMKKEGRMKMSEVLKEAERLGEIARKKVESKIYERAIEERKRAMSINEDESLSEFINQEAIKEVEKEIKELEKKLMEVIADKNTMTGGK